MRVCAVCAVCADLYDRSARQFEEAIYIVSTINHYISFIHARIHFDVDHGCA